MFEKFDTRILGVDPGGTNGLCYMAAYEAHLVPLPFSAAPGGMTQIKGTEALALFLERLEPLPTLIVFERYVIEDLTREQNSGELETVQNIGVVKSFAARHNINIVGQLRTVKKQGFAWSPNVRGPGAKHLSHMRDAHAHVIYYCVMNKLYKVVRRGV